MADKPVRVRFAPSPTGSLHIGGARTALFNWLFARHSGGKFILRIEDTDQNRFVEGSLDEIMQGLRWLGLEWDEGPDKGGDYGPYVQSQRLEHYQKWANWLVEQGKAYRCYATAEELDQAREASKQANQGWAKAGYERLHRFLTPAERAQMEAERSSYVIRLAMPLEGEIVVADYIRGTIRFPVEELSDTVLLKSDGFPTYHLAMAVDDHVMEISHVMRSDEWLPSLPTHHYLYEVFGWEAPVFVHLPMMVYNGKKISKRNPPVMQDGRIIPVLMKDYITAGFQPEAVVNWLANIGWNFGDDIEMFSVEQAIEKFTLDRISPAPTEMPFSKLEHLNGLYIRKMKVEDFIAAIQPLLVAEYGEIDEVALRIIAPHVQERANPLSSGVPIVKFLFGKDFQPPSTAELIPKRMEGGQVKELLEKVHAILSNIPDFHATTQETAVRGLAEQANVKAGNLFNPIRWATTNQQIAPPLFDSTQALGQSETLRRLQMAIDSLS